jgi:type II secretory pathway pseudopilin PulG
MNPVIITLIVVAVVLVAALIVLYLYGRKMQKKQAEQKDAMDAAAQTISFFIIDKKKLRIKEAGLPKIVYEQTPKYLRRSKLPILKVKVGPKVMSLICDDKLYPTRFQNKK